MFIKEKEFFILIRLEEASILKRLGITIFVYNVIFST